jgi:hypothetical protein
VRIDVNAGGFGWFIDPTPGDDAEFARAEDSGALTATADSAAFGRVDLLSVVMHELGHVYGLEDLPVAQGGHDLMATALVSGERRLPGRASQPVTSNAPAPVVAPVSTAADRSTELLMTQPVGPVVAPVLAPAVHAAELVTTQSVSAFSDPGEGTLASPSSGAGSGAALDRRPRQDLTLPGSSLLGPTLAAALDMRPDRETGNVEVRQDRRGSPESARQAIIDDIFSTLSSGEPLVNHGTITRSSSPRTLDALLAELENEMLVDVAGFGGSGSSARRRHG